MNAQISDKITSLEIIKVLPTEHKEVINEVKDQSTIQKIMASMEYETDENPLFEDLVSPRYFLMARNGQELFAAQVLRSFINFGEGWFYITNESFLGELEEALKGIEPSLIIKPEEGKFEFVEH